MIGRMFPTGKMGKEEKKKRTATKKRKKGDAEEYYKMNKGVFQACIKEMAKHRCET